MTEDGARRSESAGILRTTAGRVVTTPAPLLQRADARPVEWRIEDAPVPYAEALRAMDARVDAIRAGTARELVWLVEHPSLYTAGTSARDTASADARFPVHQTDRGGQVTYHGPGQRIAYLMLDLTRRRQDVRGYVAALEEWVIATLAAFNVRGERRDERVGVWVRRPDKLPGSAGALAEDKIAAIGIRIRHWITLHGISLNVEPDLTHYDGITPCGIAERHLGVTSLVDLGQPVDMPSVDIALRHAFEPIFGPTVLDTDR